jgi:heme-degrading monooxygenase HmoA
MMTIVTHVTLKEGSEPEWDAAMRTRLAAVRGRPGWIGTQLLIPSDGLHRRVIIGTWQTRADEHQTLSGRSELAPMGHFMALKLGTVLVKAAT